MFLAQKSITEMKHPPYSPDVFQNVLLRKTKSALNERIFQDIEDIFVKTVLNAIPQYF